MDIKFILQEPYSNKFNTAWVNYIYFSYYKHIFHNKHADIHIGVYILTLYIQTCIHTNAIHSIIFFYIILQAYHLYIFHLYIDQNDNLNVLTKTRDTCLHERNCVFSSFYDERNQIHIWFPVADVARGTKSPEHKHGTHRNAGEPF